MMIHVAYNLSTGECLSTNSGNRLKRWIARHTANDRKWAQTTGQALPPYRWVFVHGGSWDDCSAKLAQKLEAHR